MNALCEPRQGIHSTGEVLPGWAPSPGAAGVLDSFDEAFVSAEPRPLCAFLSGNFKGLCEDSARTLARHAGDFAEETPADVGLVWRRARAAILAETGADKPWDCPHCAIRAAQDADLHAHWPTGRRSLA